MRALHLLFLAPFAGTSANAQTAGYQGNLGGTVGISVPTGEFAELKKGAAAGIDENTAAAKAAETEAALDAAIAKLEADAAAKKKK